MFTISYYVTRHYHRTKATIPGIKLSSFSPLLINPSSLQAMRKNGTAANDCNNDDDKDDVDNGDSEEEDETLGCIII